MTDMSQTSSFLDEIIQARQDSRELPQVRADLAKAQGELGLAYEKLNRAYAGQDNLADEIADLRRQLSEAQAIANDATFRETEVRRKLEGVVAVLKDSVISSQLAIDEVDPPKPVEPELVAAPAVASSPATDESYIPGVYPWSKPQAEVTHDIGFVHEGNNPDYQRAMDECNSAAEATRGTDGPFASSTDGQSSSANEAVVSTTHGSDAAISNSASQSDQPYANKPYWFKPDSKTWAAWIAGGGEKAPWASENDDLTF